MPDLHLLPCTGHIDRGPRPHAGETGLPGHGVQYCWGWEGSWGRDAAAFGAVISSAGAVSDGVAAEAGVVERVRVDADAAVLTRNTPPPHYCKVGGAGRGHCHGDRGKDRQEGWCMREVGWWALSPCA